MRNCFAEIKKTVKSFFERNEIDSSSKHFLLGVSGGADSVLLAHLFNSLHLNFSIAHVNYQLRGVDSDKDQKHVEDLAKQLKVAVYIKKIDAKYLKKTGESIQMLARDLRYDFFNSVMAKNNLDYLVLAHHANDNIETVLMNIFRGCGIEGLAGMQEVNHKTLRPFLPLQHSMIEKSVEEQKIKFRTDSSNAKNDYKRNYLRNIVIPSIEKKWPGFEKTMLANIGIFADEKKALNKKSSALVLDFSQSFELAMHEIQNSAENLNLFVKTGVKNGFNAASLKKLLVNSKTTESKQLEHKIGILEIKNGKLFYRLKSKPNEKIPQITLSKNIISIKGLNKTFIKRSTETIALKNVEGKIQIRKWVAGDKMIPLGMKTHKKISDLLTDQKLSVSQKSEVYLLCDDKKPLVLIGFRIDNRVKLKGTESKSEVLTIKIL